MVAVTGVEPVTFRVWTERSSQLSYTAIIKMVPRGGIEPPTRGFSVPCSTDWAIWAKQLVGLAGLEPATSRLSGVRSNHLSYKP